MEQQYLNVCVHFFTEAHVGQFKLQYALIFDRQMHGEFLSSGYIAQAFSDTRNMTMRQLWRGKF